MEFSSLAFQISVVALKWLEQIFSYCEKDFPLGSVLYLLHMGLSFSSKMYSDALLGYSSHLLINQNTEVLKYS